MTKVSLQVLLDSVGVDAAPADTSWWPSGTVVPYAFTAQPGYENPVVFLDDTLVARTGVVVMNGNRVAQSSADSVFASRPHIDSLRARLRRVVNASDKPAAYASYLMWALDSSSVYYATPQELDNSVRVAEYLEFDAINSASEMEAFDDAMAYYSFDVELVSGRHVVRVVSPDSVLMLTGERISRRPRKLTTETSVPDTATKFIFVNGVRTLEGGAFQTRNLLQRLLETGPFPHGHATYYWNRNLHGEYVNFANSTFGCAARAYRDSWVRKALGVVARFAYCKFVDPLASKFTILVPDDFAGSFSQYLRIQHSAPTPGSADADRLAREISYWHQKRYHTVVVPHSQGNMILALAAPLVPSYDGTQTSGCLASLSLASPVSKDSLAIDPSKLNGMIVNGDVLIIPPLSLPNDFERVSSDWSPIAQAEIDATRDVIKKEWVKLQWGVKLHWVDDNYMVGSLSVLRTQPDLLSLYNQCMQ